MIASLIRQGDQAGIRKSKISPPARSGLKVCIRLGLPHVPTSLSLPIFYFLLIAAYSLLAPSTACCAIYKCVDNDGIIRFTTDPNNTFGGSICNESISFKVENDAGFNDNSVSTGKDKDKIGLNKNGWDDDYARANEYILKENIDKLGFTVESVRCTPLKTTVVISNFPVGFDASDWHGLWLNIMAIGRLNNEQNGFSMSYVYQVVVHSSVKTVSTKVTISDIVKSSSGQSEMKQFFDKVNAPINKAVGIKDNPAKIKKPTK